MCLDQVGAKSCAIATPHETYQANQHEKCASLCIPRSIARYECNAGPPFNRRRDNFSLTTHDVTCQEDATFTEEWPTCANSKITTFL